MQKRILLLMIFALGASSVVTAQQPAASPEPSQMQQLQVPPVAPDFRAPQKPMPALDRVGVDMNQQRPLALREALAMALENNKDIEVARENVRVAEFDLLGAQGAYDPRFNTTVFYERAKSPISSFLSGGQNGSVIQSDYAGVARLEGLAPDHGGSYRIDFSSTRLTTNNQFTALNPQYPSALTVSFSQPLLRGFKI